MISSGIRGALSHRLLAFGLLLLAGAAANAGEEEPSVIDIGSRRELFVDRFLIDRLTDERRAGHTRGVGQL